MKKKSSEMNQFTPESRIDDFLKKPLKKTDPKSFAYTQEQKKEFLRKVYTQEPSFASRNQMATMFDYVKRQYYWRKRLLLSNRAKKFSYESLPLIIFSAVSCYVTFLMQYEVDEMQRKVFRVKSMRQEEVERENELLSGALSGKVKYVQRPISDTSTRNKYKLDGGEDEEEESLVKIPLERSEFDDLNADEMKKLMEQFNKKSGEMGQSVGPNPGYSLNVVKNQREIEKFRQMREDQNSKRLAGN